MNKSELIKKVAKRSGVSAKQVQNVLEECFHTIADELGRARVREVKIAKFGTFTTIQRAERMGRNPKTGEAIVIPAKGVVKFKPCRLLKEWVTT